MSETSTKTVTNNDLKASESFTVDPQNKPKSDLKIGEADRGAREKRMKTVNKQQSELEIEKNIEHNLNFFQTKEAFTLQPSLLTLTNLAKYLAYHLQNRSLGKIKSY